MAKGLNKQENEENRDEIVSDEENDDGDTMKGGAKAKTKSKKKSKPSSSSKTTKKSNRGRKPSKGGKGSKKLSRKDEGRERYFKLIDSKTGKSYGRYTGETPKQAASKGFTKLLQKLKEKGKHAPKQSIIYLRESTRGSMRKIYGYEASRQKLDSPQELKIRDKETGQKKIITYHFRNKIKKVHVPEQFGGAKYARSNKKSSGIKKKNTGTKTKDSNKKSKTKKSTSKTSKPSKTSKTNKKGGSVKKSSSKKGSKKDKSASATRE